MPVALAASAALAACGAASHAKTAAVKTSPAALVSQTFSASNTINSGRVALALTLNLDGVKALGGQPATLNISGPFQRDAAHGLSTDLAATVSIASSSANLGFDKVGKKLYLGLDGTFYELPTGHKESPSVGASGDKGMLAGLGIHPKSWLLNPHIVGTVSVGGVDTGHLTAQINVANVLADVSKLVSRATGATGAAGTSSNALALVQSAITSAQVDVYTGIADHIVRKFDLAIAFTVPQIATGALGGLTGGSLKLDITLTELNQPQTITAPANPQPSSKILNGVFALESKFGSLASLVAGASSSLSGGSSGATASASGSSSGG